MEPADKAEELTAGRQNQRATPRFEVDAVAELLLVAHGATLHSHVVDLSLTGCRLRTLERFPGGTKHRVEVTFKVRGLAFRFCGVTQWTDGRNQVGIRFVDVSERRKEEFLEAISEVEAEDKAKRAAEKEAAEEEAAARLAAEQNVAVSDPESGSAQPQITPPATFQPSSASAQPGPRPLSVQPWGSPPRADSRMGPSLVKRHERRSHGREGVDSSAVIFLVHSASRLSGRILDLSPGGCRIRTDEPFPVGIFTRVETEFHLEGMPFRLGGVVQAIHDRQHIGIRFLDMSARKHEQLETLIEDLEELKRAVDRE